MAFLLDTLPDASVCLFYVIRIGTLLTLRTSKYVLYVIKCFAYHLEIRQLFIRMVLTSKVARAPSGGHFPLLSLLLPFGAQSHTFPAA